MNKINLDVSTNTRYFGIHQKDTVIIYLRTHYRCYKKESNLITSITKTIAHEEIHIILRRFSVKYSTNEENVLKRLQIFLYPELC